jgi:MAPEG family
MLHRNRNLDTKLLKEAFGEEHKKLGVKPARWGYPDMGCGQYSQVLPYNNWFNWNCAMRAHQNAVENIAVSVFATLAAWYFDPLLGAVFGAVILATRVAYTAVYMSAPASVELASRANSLAISAALIFSLVKTF